MQDADERKYLVLIRKKPFTEKLPNTDIFLIGLLLSALVTVVPIFIVRLPPLMDLPNHLARFWLLAGGAQTPPTSAMYRIDWSRASTNVGLDIVFATIGRITGYLPLVRVLEVVVTLGPPAGAIALNRIVFGRWHFWQITGLILAWTATALLGFLSYQVSLVVALFAIGAELVVLNGARLLPFFRVTCAVVIFVFHPFGLVYYLFLLGGCALGPQFSMVFSKQKLRHLLVSVGPVVVFTGIVVAILYLFYPHPPGTSSNKRAIYWALSFKGSMLSLISPILTYRRSTDLIFAGIPVVIVLVALLRRDMRFHAGLFLVGAALAALSLVMPFTLGDAAWINRRLPLMAMLTLFASVQPGEARTRAQAIVLTTLLTIATIAHTIWIGRIWQGLGKNVDAVERALSAVPAGSAVMPVLVRPGDPRQAPLGRYLASLPPDASDTTLRHVAALAVPERRAFIPTLFAIAGQQPLRVLAPWDQIAVSSSLVPDIHVLDRPITASDLNQDPYVEVWRTRFDYVLVEGADQVDGAGPFVRPPELQLVRDEGYARLYRVARGKVSVTAP